MKHVPSRRRLLPGLFLAALALAPCAGAQTVTLRAAGKDVRIVAGDAAALPADFPPDVALPQPHVLVQVERAGTTTTVEADTPGDVPAVAAQLRARMQADGWTAARVAQPPSGLALAWEKDARAVVAWLKPAAVGVRLQLQLLPKR